jgi:hypothetical protein
MLYDISSPAIARLAVKPAGSHRALRHASTAPSRHGETRTYFSWGDRMRSVRRSALPTKRRDSVLNDQLTSTQNGRH